MNPNAIDIKISELPEEVTEEGLKIYGPTSYETQVAILSHYLHTLDGKHDIASGEKRYEILGAIRDYIEYKHKQDKKNPLWEDVSEEDIWMAAESPLENDLFADFFKVPFPAPENPKFTFIVHRHNVPILRITEKCPLATSQRKLPRVTFQMNLMFYVVVFLARHSL